MQDLRFRFLYRSRRDRLQSTGGGGRPASGAAAPSCRRISASAAVGVRWCVQWAGARERALHGSVPGAPPPSLRQLSRGRGFAGARSRVHPARSPRRARPRGPRRDRHGVPDLPSGSQPRAVPGARCSRLAPPAARDGLGRTYSGGAVRAAEGSSAQRGSHAGRGGRSRRARCVRRLGLVARRGSTPGAGLTGRVCRADGGMGRERRGLSREHEREP